ncbi:hypothetical protein RZS08_62150, partial [Arthrospira platensis SPKY1]|nr:hypothetical protein [Arthrospira platensis SPKY1]
GQFMGGQHGVGSPLGLGGAAGLCVGHPAVGMASLAMAQVGLQDGGAAMGQGAVSLTGQALQLALVPRTQGDGVGHQALAHAPGGQGVAYGAAVQTQSRVQ